LKKTITSVGSVIKQVGIDVTSLANRPKEVVEHIVASAERIVQIANGEDKNVVARVAQQRIRALLE
jgi:hypothetical protein